MKTLLVRGQLPPQASIRAALARRRQLRHEIDKVQGQLDDVVRVTSAPPGWQGSARRALGLFRSEDRQLADWVAETAVRHLTEAYDLLLDLGEDVEFTRDDQVVVDGIERQLEATISSVDWQRATFPCATTRGATSNSLTAVPHRCNRLSCHARPPRGVPGPEPEGELPEESSMSPDDDSHDPIDLDDPHVSGDVEADARLRFKKEEEAIRQIGREEKFRDLARRQCEIAEALCGEGSDPCTEERRCLDQKGVGYLDMDPRKMCDACEMFWYADCAKVLLDRRARAGEAEESVMRKFNPKPCEALRGLEGWSPTCGLPKGHAGAHDWAESAKPPAVRPSTTVDLVEIHLSAEAHDRRAADADPERLKEDDREIAVLVDGVMRLLGWSPEGNEGQIDVLDANGSYLFTAHGEPR